MEHEFAHLGDLSMYGELFRRLLAKVPEIVPHIVAANSVDAIYQSIIVASETNSAYFQRRLCNVVRNRYELSHKSNFRVFWARESQLPGKWQIACGAGAGLWDTLQQLETHELYQFAQLLRTEAVFVEEQAAIFAVHLLEQTTITDNEYQTITAIPIEVDPLNISICLTFRLRHYCNLAKTAYSRLQQIFPGEDVDMRILSLRETFSMDALPLCRLGFVFDYFQRDEITDLVHAVKLAKDRYPGFPSGYGNVSYPAWPLLVRMLRARTAAELYFEVELVRRKLIGIFLDNVWRLCFRILFQSDKCSGNDSYHTLDQATLSPLFQTTDIGALQSIGMMLAEAFLLPAEEEDKNLTLMHNWLLQTRSRDLTYPDEQECGICLTEYSPSNLPVELCKRVHASNFRGHFICSQCAKRLPLAGEHAVSCPFCRRHIDRVGFLNYLNVWEDPVLLPTLSLGILCALLFFCYSQLANHLSVLVSESF